MPSSDQLKQLVELHRLAELAMKDLINRLWPAEAMPSNYFGLVKRLVNACPWLDTSSGQSVSKVRGWPSPMSRCSGKRFFKLATEGPPEGKEHRTPERYFDDVLEGSRIVAEQCAKDVSFP